MTDALCNVITCAVCGFERDGVAFFGQQMVTICEPCLTIGDRARVGQVPGRVARAWFASSQTLARLKERLRPHNLSVEERDAIEDGISACFSKAKDTR